jgi:putative glutamine amidotransferase
MPASSRRPVIGITTDLIERPAGRFSAAAAIAYADAVVRAGGTPLLLPPIPDLAAAHLDLSDGFVFTGGDDPRMEQWNTPTHPAATLMHPQRQAYETALLELLRVRRPDAPVLGVCLGMQLMCLDSGGSLIQHLPDVLPTAEAHKNADHAIVAARSPAITMLPTLATLASPSSNTAPISHRPAANAATPNTDDLETRPALVRSNHHQAVDSPGRDMAVIATSPDGVIEAVASTARPFYIGVQWHPERTADDRLGLAVFKALLAAIDPP